MPVLANPKHEAFAQKRALGASQDEAYVEAGYKSHTSHAARLGRLGPIRARIEELQQLSVERYAVTVESMAAQFDEDRRLAIEWKQGSAAVQAGVAKAKLFGLMVERQQVNVSHTYALMSEEELRFELAALNAEARLIKAGQN